MIPDIVPQRFRDLIGTIDGIDLLLVQERGVLSCDLRLTETWKWLPFGLVWRFITGSKTEPDEETMFQTLTNRASQLLGALKRLEGKTLERVEAEEFLLAQEELVKMGVMDRNHPLYKEALAGVRGTANDNLKKL